MEQKNGRKEKQKITVITLRIIIRHDSRRGGRDDDDDSNNSNPYKSKAYCSEVIYTIRYLCIGAEGGNVDVLYAVLYCVCLLKNSRT